jgi:hypothetical protein
VERPAGVVLIAGLFLAASAYLVAIGFAKLLRPDAISLSLGAPLLHGLELSGPYMFLIAAGIGVAVGTGLLRMSRIARRAAIVIALVGMVLLIPKVSAETGEFSLRFFLAALAIIVRVMIVWYLWQSWTAEKFVRR